MAAQLQDAVRFRSSPAGSIASFAQRSTSLFEIQALRALAVTVVVVYHV